MVDVASGAAGWGWSAGRGKIPVGTKWYQPSAGGVNRPSDWRLQSSDARSGSRCSPCLSSHNACITVRAKHEFGCVCYACMDCMDCMETKFAKKRVKRGFLGKFWIFGRGGGKKEGNFLTQRTQGTQRRETANGKNEMRGRAGRGKPEGEPIMNANGR